MAEPQRAAMPRSADFQTNVDLDLACGFCANGRVVVQGTFDYRRPVQCWCDNPDCGPVDDDEKGTEHWLRVTADGSFNSWSGPPAQLQQTPRATPVTRTLR